MADTQPGGTVRFVQIADVHMVGFTVQEGLVYPRLPSHAWWMLSRRYDLMGQLLPVALKQIREQLQPDFIAFTGDQVDDGNGAMGQADLRQLRELVEDQAQLPVHFVYGNHDGPQDTWPALHGPLDYTFDVRDTRFVVLNSGSMDPAAEGESSAKALAELQRAITTAQGRRLVVILHQWIHPTDEVGYSIVRAAEMKQALEAYPGAVAVINGHYHSGRYSEAGGIHYCTAKAFCEPPLCFSAYELSVGTLTWTEYSLSPRVKAFVPGEPRELTLRTQ